MPKWSQERIEHVSMTTSRNKPVTQYTLNDVFVADYISSTAAAIAIGGNLKSLNACVNGRMPTYKGFKWSFKQAY